MTSAKFPEQCETMIEVRAGVDEVDRMLVALLVRRFGYMDAAARIKADRGAVRDEARKAQVLDNVAREAEAAGLEPARRPVLMSELSEPSFGSDPTNESSTDSTNASTSVKPSTMPSRRISPARAE